MSSSSASTSALARKGEIPNFENIALNSRVPSSIPRTFGSVSNPHGATTEKAAIVEIVYPRHAMWPCSSPCCLMAVRLLIAASPTLNLRRLEGRSGRSPCVGRLAGCGGEEPFAFLHSRKGDRQVMAGSVQRQAQVRRRKPAVQVALGRSRLLKSKCNHDRRLMADCSHSPFRTRNRPFTPSASRAWGATKRLASSNTLPCVAVRTTQGHALRLNAVLETASAHPPAFPACPSAVSAGRRSRIRRCPRHGA